jgi:RsiW-degrading membrane proteinase PrsW (M82 family)
VICGFVVGGVFSVMFTHLVHSLPIVEQLTDVLKASVAGLTEEPAKALILLFLVHNEKRYPYVLNGVLWGAVIGAGFAAFENAGYVLWLSGNYSELYRIALLRSGFSPFMHIVWTAAIGGALWMARGQAAFDAGRCLFSWRVLGTVAISIALHMLWNTGRGFSIIGVAFFAVIGWRMVIYFLNVGYKQLRAS